MSTKADGELESGSWYTGKAILNRLVSLRSYLFLFISHCVTALCYPYVLAFDATFIEIRDVESGRLMQIVQGNNLRLLFAEAPPSTTYGPSAMYNIPVYGNDPRQSMYGGGNDRMSVASSRSTLYYGPDGVPYNPYAQTPMRPPPPPARPEIIMVSDDRVMALQLAARTSMSDSASHSSTPR